MTSKHLSRIVAFILITWTAHANSIEPHQEYRKRIESSQNLTALKDDLFGDSINLFNGKTEFSATDIDLPGNSALPVQLKRRFNVEIDLAGGTTFNANLEGAGGWDVDAPHVSGMFPSPGWSDRRCSVSMTPNVSTAFTLTEVWQGNTVHIPGKEDRVMLGLEANTPRPSDGLARRWTTNMRDAIDCIPMKSGLTGEGYRVTTTSGDRYYFDIATVRYAGIMEKTLGENSIARISRSRIYLLASKVEDRFGNWVAYRYNNNGHPTRIWSNDGREIRLTYNGAQLTSATAAGRVWAYGHGTVEGKTRLTSVSLPDGSRWGYAYSNALTPSYVSWDGGSTPNCAEQPPPIETEFALTITHPSGATGTFQLANARQYRSGLHMSECMQRVSRGAQYYVLDNPNFFDVMSLVAKTISGPGIPTPLTWRYSYGGDYWPLWGTNGTAAVYPCKDCKSEKKVVVVNPDNSRTQYRYGVLFALNEGRLLGSSVFDAKGTVASVTDTTYMTQDEITNQPFAPRYGIIYHGGDPSTAQVRPVVNTTIHQDGVSYRSASSHFDSLARPRQLTESARGQSITNITEYHDDKSRWILNQAANVTNHETGLSVSRTEYDSNAMPRKTWMFGKLIQTISYNPDGTISGMSDGNGNSTLMSAWKRGIPQSIRYADGAIRSTTVDDNGWITSVTDENGYASLYGYDAMGRLASIRHPGDDAVAWNATTQMFQQDRNEEYGISPGHWRQTVATGNSRKEIYYDALWRPLIVREYDAAQVSDTQRFRRYAYDHAGRTTFASYPGKNPLLSEGVWTSYDALDRVTTNRQDSEHGRLTTRTDYLPNGQTRVVTPRGDATVTTFMAYGQPSYDWPIAITHPEGVQTTIARDIFGKPTELTRKNLTGSTSLTRRYIYDEHQQLCKTVEPETGTTIASYDGAGNLTWSANGQNYPSSDDCNIRDVPLNQRVARSYDARNRLKTLTFPDGRGDQKWTYTPDGLTARIAVNNADGGGEVINTYSYNRRRLLAAETLSVDGRLWSIGYGYDANGNLASHAFPSGTLIHYAPNALGQPMRAGSYATRATYHANGALRSFVYGNGIERTMAINARGLLERSRDAYGASVIHDDGLDYDANGNVVAISDGLPGARGHRDMSYDGLDRLTETVSQAFGHARYGYDVLDNLRTVEITGGPRTRDYRYIYDATNRLTNVVASVDGASVVGLGYDPRGNLSNRNGQRYVFDFGNRLREVAGKESYRYDAHGRRVSAANPAKGSIYSVYGRDGVLRFQRDERVGKTIDYIYLSGNLVAMAEQPIELAAPTLVAPDYSATGSFLVSWSAAPVASTYQLEERADDGVWTTVSNASDIQKAFTGKRAGSYDYRVRACHAAGCGGWSSTSTVTVELPPALSPELSAPPVGLNGGYTVDWNKVPSATSYRLEQLSGDGNWGVMYAGSALTKAFNGQAPGTYGYRVQACNPAGCGPFSTVITVKSSHRPGNSPTLSAPISNTTGSYTVSWSSVASATKYELQEQLGTSAWLAIHDGPGSSKTVGGKTTGMWNYRVRACNDAGCAIWSSDRSVTVLRPPAAAPRLVAPTSNTTGGYSVSWNAVPAASTYRLEERLNDGGWTVAQNGPALSSSAVGKGTGAWSYRVSACNAIGCSGYSGISTVAVTRIPVSPTITHSLKNQWHIGSLTHIQCSVAWTPALGAERYELQAYLGALQYEGPSSSVAGAYNTSSYCANSHVVRACNQAGCSGWSSPPHQQDVQTFGEPTPPDWPPTAPLSSDSLQESAR